MKKIKLSIIIPCYNEKDTIIELLNKIENLKNINKEILIVDDNSDDGSSFLIKEYKFTSENKKIFHNVNSGKGSCIISASKFITGEIVLIQDADLEYDPNDYHKLIEPIIEDKSNVVYGSRVLGKNRYFVNNFTSTFRIFANHILTLLSNLINNQNLTDAHTCYKVFKSTIFNKIKLNEKDFSFCPEITTKISNIDEKIIEIPISYNGRTYKEGKKINYKDGLKAIITIFKYKFFN